MPWAITPQGAGKPVGARRIRPGWPLADGETFTVDRWTPGMVLDTNGDSLRSQRPTEALDGLRDEAYARVNAERERRLVQPVSWIGTEWDTDERSRNNLTAALTFLREAGEEGIPVPATVTWRDANNVDRALSKRQLVQLGAAIFTHVQTVYETSWALKSAIKIAPSAAAIDAAAEWM